MVRTAIIAVLALIFAAGCTSTHRVDTANADKWVPVVRDGYLGEDVDARTVDGRAFDGKLVQMTTDSVKLGGTRAEALTNVSYIGQSPNAWGPILGGVGGVVLGAVIGGAIGTASTEPTPETLGFNSVASGVGGGMIGALIGGTAGIVAGALISQVDQYEIQHSGMAHEPIEEKEKDGDRR